MAFHLRKRKMALKMIVLQRKTVQLARCVLVIFRPFPELLVFSTFPLIHSLSLSFLTVLCLSLSSSCFVRLHLAPVPPVPCYGSPPLQDPATGIDIDCGNNVPYRRDCPSYSYCHKTSSFAKCCPKSKKERKTHQELASWALELRSKETKPRD